MKAQVHVIQVNNPAESAYKAAEAIIKKEEIYGKKVLLKPNTGFDGPAASGLCTHPEVIRGVIRYFKDRGAEEIIVGDSSVIGVDSLQALKSAGIYDVCMEEQVRCMDLNESGPIEKKIPEGYLVDSILLSRILYDVDIIVSMPVMKTHMHTGATLSIKNMKGGMYKREKNKLHRVSKPVPEGRQERSLDYGIRDLTNVLYPDYAIADGVVGVEGFGPSGGTSKPFGYLVASASAVACDMVTLQMMDLSLQDVGHVQLVAEAKQMTYEDIQVTPSDYLKWATHFQTPAEARLNLSCDSLTYVDESACSACHATLTQFLRYHSDKFTKEESITIYAGKDLDPEHIKAQGKHAYLVGNCTAKFRDLAPFCKGCPPVTSEILKMVKDLYGVTINNLGNGSFLLQTMNYRLAINPKPDLKFFEEVKPTHVCVTVMDEQPTSYGLTLAKNYGAEIYQSENAAFDLNETGVIIYGHRNRPVKTEFGSVSFTGQAGSNLIVVIENATIGFSFDHSLKSDCDLIAEADFEVPEAVLHLLSNHERKVLPLGTAFTYSTQKGAAELIENPKVGFKGIL